jgi:hypothetical protein
LRVAANKKDTELRIPNGYVVAIITLKDLRSPYFVNCYRLDGNSYVPVIAVASLSSFVFHDLLPDFLTRATVRVPLVE